MNITRVSKKLTRRGSQREIRISGPIKIRSAEHSDISRYIAFAKEHFGHRSYQAFESYLEWLYRLNPAAQGIGDLLIVTADDMILGCLHRMRLPCMNESEPLGSLVAIHNLMVTQTTKVGLGMSLIRRSMADKEVVLVPGATGKFDEIYRRMKAHNLGSVWLRKVISRPPRLRPWLSPWSNPMRLRELLDDLSHQVLGPIELVTQPNDSELGAIVGQLASSSSSLRVAWTPELVRWRVFHRFGPPSILVRSRHVERQWVLVSLGLRKAVPTARLMAFGPDLSTSSHFLKETEKQLSRLGSVALLATTSDSAEIQALTRHGLRPVDRQPTSWLVSAPGVQPVQHRYDALAGDLGLDGLPRM